MRKKRTLMISSLVMLITVLIIIAGCIAAYLYQQYFQLTWDANIYTESTEQLNNPYTGWYRIYPYLLSDTADYNYISIGESYEDDTTQWSLVEINLMEYRDGDISEYALNKLNEILAETAKLDKGIILRFLYDWDGNAEATEPEDISIILQHMEQVAPIVNNFKGQIYTLQGIFTGNHAEMHNSRYSSLEEQQLLLNKLAEVIDPSIPLAVRTPEQLRTLSGIEDPLDRSSAFSGSLLSRLGLFNDGMLGSDTDYGTYVTRSREEELAYQDQICDYVPNGGEVIVDNSYNDLSNAISDFRLMHISYLNQAYDQAVLDKWKATTYESEDSSDPYNGMNGYDYITNHLGYRYVLKQTSIQFSTFEDDEATLKISIANVGFSSSYHEFYVVVTVTNDETGDQTDVLVDTDTRYWSGGSTTELSVPLDIRNYATGTYSLKLSIINPVDGSEIQLASNQDLGSLALGKYQWK